MAYLQITTRCNMQCSHCCYSCAPGKGKHGDYNTILAGIRFAADYNESITIGGGEPTLHPRFFDILRECLNTFEYVWMATNGGNTKAMYRLKDIIDNCDYENVECNCSIEDQESGYCNCYDKADILNGEGKLTVALSTDHYHDPINPKIWELWHNRVGRKNQGFELRNVLNSRDGASRTGRAERTGAGWHEHCVCSDIMIKPDGKLRACGCPRSTVIGDVWSGCSSKGEKLIRSDKFQKTNCYRGWS